MNDLPPTWYTGFPRLPSTTVTWGIASASSWTSVTCAARDPRSRTNRPYGTVRARTRSDRLRGPMAPIRVAFDVGPLHGHRTGIGVAVEELAAALRKRD